MNKIYIISANENPYAFVKQRVAEKFNIDVNEIEIAKDQNGKPFIENLKGVFFNVSNSNELQAVAISDSPVGVDIEKVRKANLSVAKRFCKEEYEYIIREDSQNRLFEVWTKKEAYLKYTGKGIKGGLDSFNVFGTNPKIKTIAFDGYILSYCCEREMEIIKG